MLRSAFTGAVLVAAWAIGPCFGGGDPAHLRAFSSPQSVTVVSYKSGLWIGRLSIERMGEAWRGQVIERDPWSFRQLQAVPIALSFRDGGYLEASLGNGSKLIWESPTRLIRITWTGQRITHTSQFPILVFSPQLLPANRIVLQAYLADKRAESFSVSSLEDGALVRYTFNRAEQRTASAVDEQRQVRRWGGFRPSIPTMYEKAEMNLTAPFDMLLSDEGELLGWNDPTQDTVTVVEGYESYSAVAPWREKATSQPQFTTVTLASKQVVPMSDYVPLVATIMMPADSRGTALPGRFPAILIRTPYGRMDSLKDAFKFVSRGYVVVSQDVRGTGDSAGFFHPLHEDITDGDDTLNWIAAQPWSDGRVGMFGGSYLGRAQWQAAASGNQHLKAMVSIVPTTSAFGDLPYINGMFFAGVLTWAVSMASTPEQLADALKKDLNKVASELPLIDADVRAVGHEIPFWRYWVNHSSLDEYWQKGNVLKRQGKIDVPVLHVVGWYDDGLRGTMTVYDMMKANGRAHQHLLVGPWPHVVNSVQSLAELSFGADAARSDLQYQYVRWFDRWLKGVVNHVDTERPVSYFTMGKNEWHSADEWPPKTSVREKWYLHSNGSANRPEDGARLTRALPKERQEADHYAHDPAEPVPYLVDIRANQIAVPEDYQEVEHRMDTLEYTTEKFDEPFEITGDATAVLYAATDSKDTDWVVRVTDVFPDGRSINIIDGYLRARFRKGMEKEELVSPGEVIRYRIPMTWTSYRFAPGHRMRVIIASAAAGAFVVNTNTGNPMGTDRETRVARQSIYHSARYPSHIEISVARR